MHKLEEIKNALFIYAGVCEEGAIRLMYDTKRLNDANLQSTQDNNTIIGDTLSENEEFVSEGRVELCFHNVWGAIHDQNWTNLDAAVACHQLGFSRYGEQNVCSFYVVQRKS